MLWSFNSLSCANFCILKISIYSQRRFLNTSAPLDISSFDPSFLSIKCWITRFADMFVTQANSNHHHHIWPCLENHRWWGDAVPRNRRPSRARETGLMTFIFITRPVSKLFTKIPSVQWYFCEYSNACDPCTVTKRDRVQSQKLGFKHPNRTFRNGNVILTTF